MTLYKNNRPAITNPDWQQRITIANGATFDGTDSVTDTQSARLGDAYYGSWPWSNGFLVKPAADLTDIPVVMYQDYNLNEKRGVSTAQTVNTNLLGGVWNEERIIKITNNTGVALTINIGA
jgi:hypothetical protein